MGPRSTPKVWTLEALSTFHGTDYDLGCQHPARGEQAQPRSLHVEAGPGTPRFPTQPRHGGALGVLGYVCQILSLQQNPTGICKTNSESKRGSPRSLLFCRLKNPNSLSLRRDVSACPCSAHTLDNPGNEPVPWSPTGRPTHRQLLPLHWHFPWQSAAAGKESVVQPFGDGERDLIGLPILSSWSPCCLQ